MSERQKVGMLLPPPILLLLLAILSLACHVVWLGWPKTTTIQLAVGIGLGIGCILLIAACMRRFKLAGTPFRPVRPVVALVSTGPYTLSRNPMYVAMAGILVAAAIALSSIPFAVAAIIFVGVVHYGVVLPEERYLRRELGAPYDAYASKVRRWI
jgi:protein-S-isoprenylcysteine O-methyltransferase Ste14